MSKRSSAPTQDGTETAPSAARANVRSVPIPDAPPSDPETIYRPASEVQRVTLTFGATTMTRVDYGR